MKECQKGFSTFCLSLSLSVFSASSDLLAIRHAAFAEAISSEHERVYKCQTTDVDSMGNASLRLSRPLLQASLVVIDDSYSGLQMENGEVTQKFVEDMMMHFKVCLSFSSLLPTSLSFFLLTRRIKRIFIVRLVIKFFKRCSFIFKLSPISSLYPLSCRYFFVVHLASIPSPFSFLTSDLYGGHWRGSTDCLW